MNDTSGTQNTSNNNDASGDDSSYNASSIYNPMRSNSKVGSTLISESDASKKNLWENLLDSVGKRSQSREGHLLLLGDHDAGKRSLLKAMNKPFLKSLGIPLDVFDEYGSNYAPFESSFLYVHDGLDYSEAV